MHELQSLALYLLDHDVQNPVLQLLVSRKKHQTCSVTSLFGYGNALQQNKLVWNLNHYASTITCLVTSLGSTVLHVLQHTQSVIHQLMTLASMYVHYHAYAARIVLVG